MADARRFADRGLLLLLVGTPALVFALVFAGSLAYFRLTDKEASPRREPVRAAPAEPVPEAAGSGRLLLTLSAQSNEPAESYLASVSLDGSDVRPITEPPPEGGLASDGYPALSPDGETIAFKRATAGPTGSTEPHVFLVDVDESSLRRLTSGGSAELNPAWSPDGERIAFARAVGGRFDVFVCASDGSGLKRRRRRHRRTRIFPLGHPTGAVLSLRAMTAASSEAPEIYGWSMVMGAARPCCWAGPGIIPRPLGPPTEGGSRSSRRAISPS